MFDISPIQIAIVLAIALLIFGPRRLPEMGRSFGRGIRDFRQGLTGTDDSATVTTSEAVGEAGATSGGIAPDPTGIDDIDRGGVTSEEAVHRQPSS